MDCRVKPGNDDNWGGARLNFYRAVTVIRCNALFM